MSTDTLDAFLARKPLYYKEIDHQRVHHAYATLSSHIAHPPTVHLVGTNGKGSTGRVLAHLAYTNGKGLSVGHYTSPHILRFNERLWLDGADASDSLLEEGHQRLFGILGAEVSAGLSYFEYTTLLALVVFERCDLIVLEAGLGGEYDATNVCDKALSIITPIGIDHQAFLGEDIEAIATTKLRSIQHQLLLAPQPYASVEQIATQIAQERGATLYHARGDTTRLTPIAEAKGWADYLCSNASVAMEALECLGIDYQVASLESLELFGRFYPLTPQIRIDVGHNPLAAQAIVSALKEPVVLIYNSLDDKDYTEVLRRLKPKLKRVEILPIPTQRATTQEAIIEALEALEIPYQPHPYTLSVEESYLVFGSFYVVEAFLTHYAFGSEKRNHVSE